MKLILLIFITINTVFGAKCPPKEVVASCQCKEVSDKRVNIQINKYTY